MQFYLYLQRYIMGITKIGRKLLDDYDQNLVNAADTAVATSTILGLPSV